MLKKISPQKLIKKIAQKYNLELILLFGSRVNGKISKESDFDIAYLSKRELNMEEEVGLNCDLMRIFQSDMVDLTNVRRANPLLLKKISDNALLLFGSPSRFTEFRLKAFKYSQDYLPYFKLEERGVNQYLKQFSYGFR